ncbi:trace amine-associated receptor 5-like, partial [Ambystoma mexicanum]|uniref:trace amine-associated receptor 5-like n=1 Tax=Ambystoma mexicanum TaxID=8296 RepID=UPI0037E74A1D
GQERPTTLCYEALNNSCPRNVHSTGIKLAIYIVCSAGMLLIVVGNLLVIISISHFKILHNPTHCLLLSLALADLLLGLTVLPPSISRSVEGCWYFGNHFCRLHTFLDTVFCLVSILHLCFIAVDRYWAICFPLEYHTKFTNREACMYIGVAWCLPVGYTSVFLYTNVVEGGLTHLLLDMPCVGSCQLLFNKLWGWLNCPMFFLPCIIMITLYMKIFIVANRQAREIKAMNIRAGSSVPTGASKTEWKAAKTLGIAMGVYLLCWLPFTIDTMVDSLLNFVTPALLFDIFIWFAYLNSACNPLIYAFSYRWFRKAMITIITCRVFDARSASLDLYRE